MVGTTGDRPCPDEEGEDAQSDYLLLLRESGAGRGRAEGRRLYKLGSAVLKSGFTLT